MYWYWNECSKLDSTSLRILTAPEVIAINQDPLGIAGDLVWKQGPREVRVPRACQTHEEPLSANTY